MSKMVQGGRYKQGTIILKSGMAISSRDLLAAKKAGVKPHELDDYLKEMAAVQKLDQTIANLTVEEQPQEPKVVEKPVQWATIPYKEVRKLAIPKVAPKLPWYKRLLKEVIKK